MTGLQDSCPVLAADTRAHILAPPPFDNQQGLRASQALAVASHAWSGHPRQAGVNSHFPSGAERVTLGYREVVTAPGLGSRADTGPPCTGSKTRGPDQGGASSAPRARPLRAPEARPGALTVVRHAQGQALLEAAVLALVAVLFLDLAAPLALLVFQLHADRSAEEALRGGAQVREAARKGEAENRAAQGPQRGCTRGPIVQEDVKSPEI